VAPLEQAKEIVSPGLGLETRPNELVVSALGIELLPPLLTVLGRVFMVEDITHQREPGL